MKKLEQPIKEEIGDLITCDHGHELVRDTTKNVRRCFLCGKTKSSRFFHCKSKCEWVGCKDCCKCPECFKSKMHEDPFRIIKHVNQTRSSNLPEGEEITCYYKGNGCKCPGDKLTHLTDKFYLWCDQTHSKRGDKPVMICSYCSHHEYRDNYGIDIVERDLNYEEDINSIFEGGVRNACMIARTKSQKAEMIVLIQKKECLYLIET